MPNPDGSVFETIARHPLFSWMRAKPRDDGPCGARADPSNCGVDLQIRKPVVTSKAKRNSSSPPELSTAECVPSTAPVSTCASTMSGASWSELAVGSTESSGGVIAFHRLEQSTEGSRRPPQLKLTLDPEPPVPSAAPIPEPAQPVDIPWRLVDPDSATTPMHEALAHSLAQMELRMAGRHSTKIAKATSSVHNDNRPHRRTRSALPTGRAVETTTTTAVVERGMLAGGDRHEEDDRKVPSPLLWKLSPPPASDSFDGPSPYNGGAGGRGKRAFEGYFAGDSTTANTAAASASASFTPRSPVRESDDDDDDDMIFAFDDL